MQSREDIEWCDAAGNADKAGNITQLTTPPRWTPLSACTHTSSSRTSSPQFSSHTESHANCREYFNGFQVLFNKSLVEQFVTIPWSQVGIYGPLIFLLISTLSDV